MKRLPVWMGAIRMELFGDDDVAELVDQGVGNELELLYDVLGEMAGGRRGRTRTARVIEFLLVAGARIEVVADLVPGALVLRLFLAPHHFTHVGISREHRFHLRHGEWIELLDAHQRDVGLIAVLDRDAACKVLVLGEVDDAHAAFAKFFENSIMGNRLTDHGKSQRGTRTRRI